MLQHIANPRIAALVALILIFATPRLRGFEPEPVPVPADAVRWAAADIATFPVADRVHIRYLFTLYNDPAELAAISYMLNVALSQSTIPRPMVEPVPGTDRHLLRMNLLLLAPREADYKRLFLLWETLATRNFYFHSIDPKFFTFDDGISVDAAIAAKHGVRMEVPAFNFNGKRFTGRVFPAYVPAIHLAGGDGKGLQRYAILREETASECPIFRADQLTAIALRVTNDGLYYEFRGIERNPVGKTAEEAWLESIGGDAKIAANIRSDERAGMWRRRLNDHPAAIEWFQTTGTRLSLGTSITFLTRDFVKGGSKANVHPIYNLLEYKYAATEAFGSLPNGMIEFALFDGQGNLQNVAPGNIAIDTSAPHGAEVEPAHSCIRCHASQGMYQPLENHVTSLLRSKLNIFDDEASKEDVEDTLDRIAGLYGGDPTDALRLARLTHAKATHLATGGVFGLDSVNKSCTKVSEIFNRYYYLDVTPRAAALDFGYRVETNAEAKKLLAELVPLLPLNEFGFSPETPAAIALRDWDESTTATPKREDFEPEYAVLMTRVYKQQLEKIGEK